MLRRWNSDNLRVHWAEAPTAREKLISLSARFFLQDAETQGGLAVRPEREKIWEAPRKVYLLIFPFACLEEASRPGAARARGHCRVGLGAGGRRWDPEAGLARRRRGCQSRRPWGRAGRRFRLRVVAPGRSPAPGSVGKPRPQPPAARPDEGAMELEPELLLQEARENVEAAQSYRRELGHRLQGLQEARRQVGGPRP